MEYNAILGQVVEASLSFAPAWVLVPVGVLFFAAGVAVVDRLGEQRGMPMGRRMAFVGVMFAVGPVAPRVAAGLLQVAITFAVGTTAYVTFLVLRDFVRSRVKKVRANA